MLIFNKSIIRFIAVGGGCTVIQYLILIILVNFADMVVVVASSIGFSISFLINYLLNRSFTFKSHVPHLTAFPKFMVVAGIGLGTNAVLMIIFYQLLGIYYLLAQMMTTGFVMVSNYLLHRYWSFKNTSDNFPQ